MPIVVVPTVVVVPIVVVAPVVVVSPVRDGLVPAKAYAASTPAAAHAMSTERLRTCFIMRFAERA